MTAVAIGLVCVLVAVDRAESALAYVDEDRVNAYKALATERRLSEARRLHIIDLLRSFDKAAAERAETARKAEEGYWRLLLAIQQSYYKGKALPDLRDPATLLPSHDCGCGDSCERCAPIWHSMTAPVAGVVEIGGAR